MLINQSIIDTSFKTTAKSKENQGTIFFFPFYLYQQATQKKHRTDTNILVLILISVQIFVSLFLLQLVVNMWCRKSIDTLIFLSTLLWFNILYKLFIDFPFP